MHHGADQLLHIARDYVRETVVIRSPVQISVSDLLPFEAIGGQILADDNFVHCAAQRKNVNLVQVCHIEGCLDQFATQIPRVAFLHTQCYVSITAIAAVLVSRSVLLCFSANVRGTVHRFGTESKIRQFAVGMLGQEDVLRLHVEVNESLIVQERERVANIGEYLHKHLLVDFVARREQIVQVVQIAIVAVFGD